MREDVQELAAAASELARRWAEPSGGRRAMLGIAGGPGSGKSTLALALVEILNKAEPGSTAYVPMDGFHMTNARLAEVGLAHRKGAPETFEPAQFLAMLEALKAGEEVSGPRYSRAIEEVVPNAFVVRQERLCVVEGNYLLLDQPAWRGAAEVFDETWFIDLNRNEAEQRLMHRHQVEPENPPPFAQIRNHVLTVDLPNFDLIDASKHRADRILSP